MMLSIVAAKSGYAHHNPELAQCQYTDGIILTIIC